MVQAPTTLPAWPGIPVDGRAGLLGEEGQVCRECAHFQPEDSRYSNCITNSDGLTSETVRAPPPPPCAGPSTARLCIWTARSSNRVRKMVRLVAHLPVGFLSFLNLPPPSLEPSRDDNQILATVQQKCVKNIRLMLCTFYNLITSSLHTF